MIVCVCEAVNCRTIRRTIDEGATSVREVGAKCRAGTNCGQCRRAIGDLIREQRTRQDSAMAQSRLPVLPNGLDPQAAR